MAYAIKYLFKFESSNGTTREIRVLQDGYTGEVIQRPLGRAPILKKQQNGPVHGTSLEFYAECNVDREFIEFYTSDPKAYRVDLYAGATLLWQGYITPELYSEPDIAPPYDVQVVATDGVGELKLYDYAAQGAVTLRALLSGLLSRTGLGTDIYLISSLKPGSAGAGSLLEKTINLDYMAGNSCYEVLTYILDTLHATITWWKGAWILSRETNVTFTNGKVRYFNTAGNSALLNDSVQVLGKMYANPAWPVGQLSTVIDPAKNRVTVQAPWHVVTCLRNSDMGSDSDWVKAKNARYETDGYILPININTGTSETAVISQATSMAGLRVPMSLSVKATGATSEISAQVVGAVLGVLLTYKVGNVTYHLVKGDDGVPVWQQGGDIGTYIPLRTRIDFQQQLATWDSSRIEAEELSIENIPPFLQGTTFPAGTLTVYILGYCAKIYGAYLDVVLPKGYQDILRISNGARGEGSEVEIAIGRETTDNAYYAAFLQGLLLDSGNLITSFSDANFPAGMDYLAFIARDYALSVALPRAKVTGTVYLESGVAAPPLVFTKGALNYWLQTWSWNLKEDELEIDALTLPSASLTVESETILESNGSTVSSADSAGSSGPSSSMDAGTNYFELATDPTLVQLRQAYSYLGPRKGLIFDANAEADTNADFEKVALPGGGYALHSKLPFYSDSFISAGGLSDGGDSEGITWAALAAATSEQINLSHLTTALGGYYTKAQVDALIGSISGFSYEIYPSISAVTSPKSNILYLIGPTGTGADKYEEYVYSSNTWTKIGDTSIDLSGYLLSSTADSTYAKITSLNSLAARVTTDEGIIDGCFQSLQSQIDSVSARNNFDELTASAFFADVAAVSALRAGAIELGGSDLATTLSGLNLAISSEAGARASADTALSNRITPIENRFDASGKLKFANLPNLYIARTQVKSSAANDTLLGITAISNAASSDGTDKSRIEWDSTNNAWHFIGNLYADGFVSAGGLSTAGGSTGIDLAAMWASLTNNPADAYASTKIAAAHIPDMASAYGYLKANQTITLTGVVTGSGTTSIATSIADGALSIEKVNGLQAALNGKANASALAGYQPLDSDLTAIAALTGGGLLKRNADNTWGLDTNAYVTSSGVTSVATGTGLTGGTITGTGTVSISSTYQTYIANGNTAYGWGDWRTRVGSLETNLSNLTNRVAADESAADAAFQSLQSQIDSVSARNNFDEITATVLFGDQISGTCGYFEDMELGGYSLKSIPNAYLANSAITINGVAVSLGGTRTITQAQLLGTSAVGSASVPVWYNGSAITAITPASMFSALSSTAATNLSVTIAGQGRTITDLYARYDKDGGEIAPNMTTIGNALRSLQSQVDSVSARNGFDELYTTTLFADMFSVSNVYAGVIDATGTIHATTGIWSEGYVSAGGLASSSDERLKSDIKDFGYSAEMLMALRPREWDWNEKSYMKGHAAGVVAQELQQVMPYAIVERQYLSVNYDMLHAVEIAGLQDHETRIRQLEAENRELKRRLNMN